MIVLYLLPCGNGLKIYAVNGRKINAKVRNVFFDGRATLQILFRIYFLKAADK
jgi:hypothetical protein